MTNRTVSSLINKDSILAMSEMEEESIDLIISDPPFGIDHFKENTSYNRNGKLVLSSYVEVENDVYDAFSDKWIEQAARILAPKGSMYVVSGWSNLEDVLRALRQNNLHTINHIIWEYPFGVYTKRKYVSSHYHILFVGKSRAHRTFNRECYFGDKEKGVDNHNLNYMDRADVWYIKRENWTGRVKTQNKLPRYLIEKMVSYSSSPGDLVLDPFMGSGQVPFVAKTFARRYIGIEISTQIYNFAKYRINSNDYYGDQYEGE